MLPFSAMAAGDFVVRDMRVEGLQRISEGTVFNYLPINIGDTLDDIRIREAIRALYGQDLFDDRLKLAANMITAQVNDSYAPVSRDAGFEGSLIGNALVWNPTRDFYATPDSLDQPSSSDANPLAMLEYIDDKAKTITFLSNFSATLEIIEGTLPPWDSAAFQWYINSEGTETNFYFIGTSAYVRRPDGTSTQLYPPTDEPVEVKPSSDLVERTNNEARTSSGTSEGPTSDTEAASEVVATPQGGRAFFSELRYVLIVVVLALAGCFTYAIVKAKQSAC